MYSTSRSRTLFGPGCGRIRFPPAQETPHGELEQSDADRPTDARPGNGDFANGGHVAKFGFAVNNRKKNQSTGQWEDEPVFLDVEAFNRENGRKLADLVEQYLKKGHQVYLECSMKLDTWNDKTTGEKRQKLKFVVNDMQFLEPQVRRRQRRGRPACDARRVGAGAAGGRMSRSNGPAPSTTTKNPNRWTRRRPRRPGRRHPVLTGEVVSGRLEPAPRKTARRQVMATKAKQNRSGATRCSRGRTAACSWC